MTGVDTTIPDIGVLVCTRDRCASLARLLASITRAAAASAGLDVAVVVVDNGSSDDTPRLLERWCAAQTFPTRIVTEARPGLSRARNAGLAHVRGRIVAMVDDDCVLHADYLSALAIAFGEVGGPAIIGGRILLGDPADLPVTVKLEDHPMLAVPGAFPGGFVMGANLAFTCDVPARVGAFDERFGAGARFVAAEDTDYLLRAMRLGIALRYDHRFVVDHHHGRREPAQERELLAGYSFGDGALYAKHLGTDRAVLGYMRRDLADLWLDVRRTVTRHQGVRYFYAFRLLHKARGFACFLLSAAVSHATAWKPS